MDFKKYITDFEDFYFLKNKYIYFIHKLQEEIRKIQEKNLKELSDLRKMLKNQEKQKEWLLKDIDYLKGFKPEQIPEEFFDLNVGNTLFWINYLK